MLLGANFHPGTYVKCHTFETLRIVSNIPGREEVRHHEREAVGRPLGEGQRLAAAVDVLQLAGEYEVGRRPRDESRSADVGRVGHRQEQHGAVRRLLRLARTLPCLQNCK